MKELSEKEKLIVFLALSEYRNLLINGDGYGIRLPYKNGKKENLIKKIKTIQAKLNHLNR